jgi:hypothetical protein
MTQNTLHRFRPFVKFHVDRHFIYIAARGDKHKEELQSYCKLTEEDMGEITKEWPTELLVPESPPMDEIFSLINESWVGSRRRGGCLKGGHTKQPDLGLQPFTGISLPYGVRNT